MLRSLVQYLNNAGDGADGRHNAITSFFIWAWDANADDTFGLGGMVEKDWETLDWRKIAALMDNNSEYTYGLGLQPWYLPGYILPGTAGESTVCSVIGSSSFPCTMLM